MSESLSSPDHACIAQLAYTYWTERGRPHGSPEVDWHRAVATLTKGAHVRIEEVFTSSLSLGPGTL
jgi:DUF2934 family protein